MRALAAAALGCLLAGCAAGGGGGAAPATDASGTPSMMPPAAGASATSTAPATAPDRDRVRTAEEARVGALRVLRARGVAEVRWRDASGDHFEQGDADLRWCDGRGIAVSVSKLGEPFSWAPLALLNIVYRRQRLLAVSTQSTPCEYSEYPL